MTDNEYLILCALRDNAPRTKLEIYHLFDPQIRRAIDRRLGRMVEKKLISRKRDLSFYEHDYLYSILPDGEDALNLEEKQRLSKNDRENILSNSPPDKKPNKIMQFGVQLLKSFFAGIAGACGQVAATGFSSIVDFIKTLFH